MIKALWQGFATSWRHLFSKNKQRHVLGIKETAYFQQLSTEGIATIQYPHQQIPVPENGRYQLHVEMGDCIVCDLCAKICPVNCITIEAIKSPTEIGLTSDGSKKRLYAAQFDIDMAKCMYCGLCTIVCPTECIIMTNQYDRTFQALDEMIYPFSTMTIQEAQAKKQEYETFMAQKQAAKALANEIKNTD